MVPRIAEPRPGAKPVRADVCRACGGIWLDEYELAEVSDPLGGLPFRMAEIAELGAPGKHLATCPRCHAVPVEVAVLDVALDVCPGCKGVWLDGGEYEALARATALEAAQKAEATGSYRVAPNAAKAVKHGLFDCPRCAKEKPTSEGMLTPSGLVCGPCFYEHDEAPLLADASRDHGELTQRMQRGAFRPHDASIGREGWARIGAQAGGAISILGLLLGGGNPGFCEHCGRRRSDPACSHY